MNKARGGSVEGLPTARTRSVPRRWRGETSGALAGRKPRQDPEREQENFRSRAKRTIFMNIKSIAIWTGVTLILVASVWGLFKLANQPSTLGSSTQTIQVPALNDSDITRGDKKAKVVLIEYSDFQCPACGYYHPLVKQLTDEYKDQMLFVYRFFPLSSIHKNAVVSSQAAYAAHLQGKFWDMHDMIFEHQKDWSEAGNAKDIFVSYAKQLGLNEEKFKQDMDSNDTLRIINNQYALGAQAGINSTPTFFLNGTLIQNPKDYSSFKSLIDKLL